MLVRITILLILFTFTQREGFCQEKLQLDFDYTQFKFDSTSNYLEIYYSFNQRDLTLIKNNSEFAIKATMVIQIEDTKSKELVVNKDWIMNRSIKDTSDSSISNSLLGVVGFVLKAGEYRIYISVEDVINTEIKSSLSYIVTILPYTADRIFLSNIQLSSKISKENTAQESIFYKNTYEVIPNPSMLFTNKFPVVYYYCEIYNMNLIENEKFTLNKLVYDSEGNEVYNKSKVVSSKYASVIDVGFINMTKFSSGTFTLVFKLKSNTSNKISTSSKKFFYLDPNKTKKIIVSSTHQSFLESEFNIFVEEECDEMFMQSRIIANSSEINQYEKLKSLNKKREFLFAFWKKRDLSRDTDKNEFKEMYFDRINSCIERFGNYSNLGYKTEKGRIYVLYGEPAEITRHPNESDMKPYEIWTYNDLEGGVFFIFGDVSGFNNYELLHSNKRGEYYNEDWSSRLRIY